MPQLVSVTLLLPSLPPAAVAAAAVPCRLPPSLPQLWVTTSVPSPLTVLQHVMWRQAWVAAAAQAPAAASQVRLLQQLQTRSTAGGHSCEAPAAGAPPCLLHC